MPIQVRSAACGHGLALHRRSIPAVAAVMLVPVMLLAGIRSLFTEATWTPRSAAFSAAGPSAIAATTTLGRVSSSLVGASINDVGRSKTSGLARRAETAEVGVRVGVLTVPGQGEGLRETFEKFNVTNQTYFQTEVPTAFQMPLAAKLLAMSNTVDVVVAAHGTLGEERQEIIRGYMTVSLTTNVPIVPVDGDGEAAAADVAVQMAEIRQQALLGAGPRRSNFFGIGTNTSAAPAKKEKVYF
mmetsp:Transcript_49568/g.95711  ORF Transcript_49568/g.95711 Transcript_49568/m.95711 type:complete len:242 (+) Transcript_49568:77-802(+)